MPFISDAQLMKLQNQVGGIQRKAQSVKDLAVRNKSRLIGSAETIGAGGVAGFARGKLEEADGTFNLPFVEFDAEAAGGLTLLGLGYYMANRGSGNQIKNEENAQHVINIANGVLAHYTGQIMRKMAKTGEFTLVAGRAPQRLASRTTVGCSPLQDALTGNF